ncbi:LytTR family DNA-binding domain-containing protein [Larkinella knui]|uniref:DNA-binding response regulator n=1 Tax=Larkinella knui TaxID=2025310 RepID=A0A3P1CEZ0_9BACT|nr:LytTR family DNA-binding domain-containing protein [Larkinella knui]RRB11882.1 DNA-binding response regulator [Larkinella knui]
MSKIQCLVVDDERLALEVMEAYIERVPFLHLAKLCSTPVQALEFIARNPIDVLFLDIEMPGLNGLQFLQTLKAPPLVVLTTAYSQFAVEAFDLNVTDYLLKPIPFNRFLAAVQKVQTQLGENRLRSGLSVPDPKPLDSHLFIKSGVKTIRVDLGEILFIEGKKDYVLVHTRQNKIATQLSLTHFMEKLPADLFARIHRSFIVALTKIESIERNRILIDQTEVPIGELYREDFFKRIG